METNKIQWRRISEGEELPCDLLLMRYDGTITRGTCAGVKAGQDAYYLPIEELRTLPKEESEDERIRKELIGYFTGWSDKRLFRGFKAEQMLAWLETQGAHKKFRDSIQIGDNVTRNEDGVLINLSRLKRMAKKDEKQGGQKLTEVEHRFKVGDFVVNKNGLIRQIIDLKDDVYFCLREECWDDETHPWHGTVEYVDTHWHKWTLEDAKDGDVLATLDYILIFKEFLKDDGGISYCHYDFGAGNPQFIWSEDGNWYFGKEAIIHPATKEQRDILFAKMHEAGYEWDAEKKELKNIKQKSTDVKICEALISVLKSDFDKDATIFDISVGEIITWLKKKLHSLNSQSTWKPTEKQMKAFENVYDWYRDNSNFIPSMPLHDLYMDLKKLKEE